MFCGKCGAQNADSAEFCTNCGAKLKKNAPTIATTVSGPNQNEKNRKVGMIAVAIVAVVVIILGVVFFGGRSYKATVDKFVDAYVDANIEAILDLTPKKIIDYLREEYEADPDILDGHDDMADLIDHLISDANEHLQHSLNRSMGKDWIFSYEITEAEDINGDVLDLITDLYEDAGVEISAAKIVTIVLTGKVDETELSNSLDILLIKVGRSWYLEFLSIWDFL